MGYICIYWFYTQIPFIFLENPLLNCLPIFVRTMTAYTVGSMARMPLKVLICILVGHKKINKKCRIALRTGVSYLLR